MTLIGNRQKHITMKTKRLFTLLVLLLMAGGMKLQAQYDGLIVKMDYFDPATPKYKRHVEMMYDIFTDGYWLTISTEKTLVSKGSTKVQDDIAKTSHYYRSKTITDTIINLTKEDFNKLVGDCYQTALKLVTEKMRTSAFEFVGWSGPTLDLSIENGTVTMQFSFECPICPKDNYYEEQFRDVLSKILSQGGLDSEKILGKCQ